MKRNMTKIEILDLMKKGRADLEMLVSKLNEAQMERRSTPDQGSVKDTLAHISAWECYVLAWIEAETKGEKPDLPFTHMTEEDVDRLNAQTYAQQHEKPLDAILSDFRKSFQTLLAKAEGFSEEDLLDPTRFAWTAGKPIWYYFGVNTFWHYAEHLDQIRTAAQTTGP